MTAKAGASPSVTFRASVEEAVSKFENTPEECIKLIKEIIKDDKAYYGILKTRVINREKFNADDFNPTIKEYMKLNNLTYLEARNEMKEKGILRGRTGARRKI